MNIHDSYLALIRVYSRSQRNLNSKWVQRIGNGHKMRIRSTITRVLLYI